MAGKKLGHRNYTTHGALTFFQPPPIQSSDTEPYPTSTLTIMWYDAPSIAGMAKSTLFLVFFPYYYDVDDDERERHREWGA